MDALLNSLGKAERDLIRQTEPDRMDALDEEALVDLHKRIRRARNKYVGIYRREGAAKVGKKGGRGLAKSRNSRNAGRAEVLEDALARVSAQLATAAAAAAEELRAARLAAANPPGTWPGGDAAQGAGDEPAAQVVDRTPKGPGRAKRDASTRAQGSRRQATRDSR